jgi:outer membrane protein OmpA-like peptidoglycan-associated protein
MRKSFTSFFVLTFLATTVVFSQPNNKKLIPNGLFVDAHVGVRSGGGKVSSVGSIYDKNRIGLHLDGGVGYMFNKLLGIKGDLGFDFFNVLNTRFAKPDKSLTLRANIQGIVSLSDLAKLGSEDFRLLLHAGPGIASNFNPSFRRGSNNSRNDKGLIGGNDDMYNIAVGLTTQYHLTKTLSLNADVTAINLLKQEHYLDRMYAPAALSSYNSVLWNFSLGVQYRIDDAVKKIVKKKTVVQPATPTVVQPEIKPEPIPEPKPTVSAEPKPEPKPVIVDADNDGVTDAEDKCPALAGVPAQSGCPVIEYKAANIQFKLGSAVLNEAAKKELNNLASYLIKIPSIKLSIEGHADATGTQAVNAKLSLNRAKIASKYLTSKGVSPESIRIEGFGSSRPIKDNNTSKGRSANRRAEFKLSY